MYKRYGIEAKRPNRDEHWSEWTQTDEKTDAERHKQNAIDLGYKARIVDRWKEAQLARELQAKIFP